MGFYRNFDSAVSRQTAAIGVAILIAVSGCSLLSSKDEAPARAPTTRVSTNANEIALPVEINNDIGKIMGGGSTAAQFSGGGSRVNVNVNVNFNGRGWTKTVTETNEAGQELSRSESAVDSVRGQPSGGQRAPAASAKVRESFGDEGEAPVQSTMAAGGGKTKRYVVKPGDTLMKISFESYGNVYRWREILNANKGKIANYNSLPPGTELTINGVGYVVIERNGKPYLIVRHDTLGKISHKVYGTNSFWRELWKNNPQLIRNPHKIYAGFTLYYRDKSELGEPIHTAKSSPTKLPTKRIPANKSKK